MIFVGLIPFFGKRPQDPKPTNDIVFLADRPPGTQLPILDGYRRCINSNNAQAAVNMLHRSKKRRMQNAHIQISDLKAVCHKQNCGSTGHPFQVVRPKLGVVVVANWALEELPKHQSR